jgi:hypothetical protein
MKTRTSILGFATLLLALALGSCSSFPPCFAQSADQPSYMLEGGTGFYTTTTPHSAAYLTLAIPLDAANKTRSYTTLEMRPIAYQTAAYSTRTGIERVLFARGNLELSGLGLAGASVGTDSLSGAFSGGGKLAYSPHWKRAEGLQFVVTMEGLIAPTGGPQPQLKFGTRYLFGPKAP